MAYKLVIADVVEVPVKFTANDGGKSANFFFHLFAKRMPQDALRALAQDNDTPISDFLATVITGWRGQQLVVDDNGTPAAFSAEALDCMLSLVGLSGLVFTAYLEACGARGKEKN